MRILITGGTGQVGWELRRAAAMLGDVFCPGRAELDLANPAGVKPWLDRHQPDLVLNPGAYTAVDKAEEEQSIAMAVNCDSPAEMASWCADNKVGLVHFSTDYVYPGTGEQAYTEDDETGPTNIYGESKLAGENRIRSSGCAHLIFRTSWVYSARGKNFLNTMLRLAETMPQLRVVDDQIGTPCPARLIADTTMTVLARQGMDAASIEPVSGIYHLIPRGEVSWHRFAEAIMAKREAITGKASPLVKAIPTSEFPTPASRPANSRMCVNKIEKTFGLSMPDWRIALDLVLADRLEA